METIITCLVVVCSAIGLGIFLHQRNPGTSPEDSARAAELIARVVRDDISKETERLVRPKRNKPVNFGKNSPMA